MNFNKRDLSRAVERIVGEGIERAEEADVTTSRISEVVWPVIQYYKDKLNEPLTKQDEPLSAGVIKSIMTSTFMFEFLRISDHGALTFWNNYKEQEVHIPQTYTLRDLMTRITDLYRQEGLRRGEERAINKMRESLGL
mgnify:CR=1 FL=1